MKSLSRYFAPPSPVFGSRRAFLSKAGNGFGMLALAGLLQDQGLLGGASASLPDPRNPLSPHSGNYPAKAQSVIWLFLNGGPSQVDTWDHKPELARRDGQALPGFDKNTGFFTDQVGPVMKSPFRFRQYGDCGKWGSEIFPNLAQHVDKMAFIHSCWSTSNNHSPALFMVNTGMSRMGFPCLGSWVTYGLGSENKSLPGFVTMYDTLGRGLPKGNASNWGSGFLPSIYQGTVLKPKGAPIDNLFPPEGMTDREQRSQLDLLRTLNQRHLAHSPEESELAARIESFELAYRMQMAAPECLDLERESKATQSLYGLDDPKCTHFAKQCLIARRLVERGVRFVQIYSGGMENERSWDGHQDIAKNHAGFAREVDTPIAGLLTDLASRGLLQSTLILCCGEFGRLPIVQKGGTGRDHNPHAFTTWMAGGGTKGGVSYGETDEIGFKAVVNKVGVHDLHATVLHLLGIDHTRLTYRYSGRDFRLTDVEGSVVRPVLV
jgi:hypothetical protein